MRRRLTTWHPHNQEVTQKRNPDILLCVTQEVVVLATPGGLRRFVIYMRRLRGRNQTQVAEAVGRSQQWVSKFENGHCESSMGDVVEALTALDASIAVRPVDASQRNDRLATVPRGRAPKDRDVQQDDQTHRQPLSASSRTQRQLQVGAVTSSHKVESAVDVGALIRQARQAAAMTQQQLADRVGTTRQWVIRLEQGRHSTTMNTALVALSELGLEMVAQLDLPRRGRD